MVSTPHFIKDRMRPVNLSLWPSSLKTCCFIDFLDFNMNTKGKLQNPFLGNLHFSIFGVYREILLISKFKKYIIGILIYFSRVRLEIHFLRYIRGFNYNFIDFEIEKNIRVLNLLLRVRNPMLGNIFEGS